MDKKGAKYDTNIKNSTLINRAWWQGWQRQWFNLDSP